VKVGSEEVRVLKLTAPMPFRILKLEYSIDNKALNNKTLQATLTLNREIAEHHVELKYRPTVPNQSCTGKIRVLTNFPSQEVIEIPFVTDVN
jgi:hypothetical protein